MVSMGKLDIDPNIEVGMYLMRFSHELPLPWFARVLEVHPKYVLVIETPAAWANIPVAMNLAGAGISHVYAVPAERSHHFPDSTWYRVYNKAHVKSREPWYNQLCGMTPYEIEREDIRYEIGGTQTYRVWDGKPAKVVDWLEETGAVKHWLDRLIYKEMENYA